MGLIIKPSKCASLSIQSGRSSDCEFHLTDRNQKVPIALVKNKPLKFLGSNVTALNKPNEMFEFLYEKFEAKLKNIDKCSLRGEYKLKIYSNYALISMRYHLSVHDVHKTHLDKLDTLARKYLKKWLNIPSHGASDIAIFHPYLLKVKAPSQLYMEGHAGNYTLMRIKGDPIVNHTLDSRLERESCWTNKSSTIVKCQQLLDMNIDNDNIFIPSTQNCPDVQHARRHEIPRAKAAMKLSIEEETLQLWNSKVQKLTMQGDFANILIEEKQNVTWQAVVKNVPRGIMSFALNSVTNTLPSPDNLKRWGKRVVSKCPLCSNTGTLQHILNFCPVALIQKRYNYRHDSVLNHIASVIIASKPDNLEVYADIPGLDINGSTIPPDVLVTLSRPDLVLLNRNEKLIFLLELTCSFETNVLAAHARKTTKYTSMKADIESNGYKCVLIPFEIGSRGYVTRDNKANIIHVFVKNNIKSNALKCVKQLSKISLLCSFSIFHAYTQPSWRSPPFLSP